MNKTHKQQAKWIRFSLIKLLTLMGMNCVIPTIDYSLSSDSGMGALLQTLFNNNLLKNLIELNRRIL